MCETIFVQDKDVAEKKDESTECEKIDVISWGIFGEHPSENCHV
jgi:hypothetical protein